MLIIGGGGGGSLSLSLQAKTIELFFLDRRAKI